MKLSVNDQLNTGLALPVYGVVNVDLYSVKLVLSEGEHDSPAWFNFLYPHLLLESKGVLATLEEGANTKALGI